jgi:uncharacterized protein
MGILTLEMKSAIEGQLGFIATVCPDGTPNLSPKGTTAVWDDDHLVFAHVHSQGTVANLLTNPAIEINIVDQLSRKGFRFKGTAVVHTSGEAFERGVRFYADRGMVRPRERIRAIVLVAVDRALLVVSPAYDLGSTEADLRRQWRTRLLESGPNEP